MAMDRREFLAASTAALACTARLAADEKAAEKPREPDLQIDIKYKGVIAFSPDSKVLAVGHGPVGDKEGICFLDPESGKRLRDFERTTDKGQWGPWAPRVLAYSPDGNWFAAGGYGYVALWDATNGRRLDDIRPPVGTKWGTMFALAFSSDSKYLLVGHGFWPLNAQGQVQKVEGLELYDAVAFCANGKQFATRLEGAITLWDYSTRKKLREFGGKRPTGGPFAFTADCARIASGGITVGKKTYLLWDVTTGRAEDTTPFEGSPGNYWALSPDGKLLASAGLSHMNIRSTGSGKITLVLANASMLKEMVEELDPIGQVQFAPNQQMLACSRAYSGIRIWKDKNGFRT
jgi:WD40 repeat protein